MNTSTNYWSFLARCLQRWNEHYADAHKFCRILHKSRPDSAWLFSIQLILSLNSYSVFHNRKTLFTSVLHRFSPCFRLYNKRRVFIFPLKLNSTTKRNVNAITFIVKDFIELQIITYLAHQFQPHFILNRFSKCFLIDVWNNFNGNDAEALTHLLFLLCAQKTVIRNRRWRNKMVQRAIIRVKRRWS